MTCADIFREYIGSHEASLPCHQKLTVNYSEQRDESSRHLIPHIKSQKWELEVGFVREKAK